MRNSLIVKVPTPEAQGKDSWIKFRRPNYGERKQVRDEVKDLDGEPLSQYILDFSLSRLVEWNWTDEEGMPLKLPKSSDDIDQFTDEEIGAFILTGFKAIRGLLTRDEDDIKNSNGG